MKIDKRGEVANGPGWHGESKRHSLVKKISAFGGLTRSPLANQDEVLAEFVKVTDSIDPDQALDELTLSYMRDFIQGMWIVKAIQEGDVE